MTAVRITELSPIILLSMICPMPTNEKINTFLNTPWKPTSLDSFLSSTVHIIPVK